MMMGSTQKMNDIYKPIRTNMPIKILLQLGEEEIKTLDKSYGFSHAQEDQLKKFSPGQGMLMKGRRRALADNVARGTVRARRR